MADIPVEVRKATPTPAAFPDPWRSVWNEMERLSDRFGPFRLPSLRRLFDLDPAWRSSGAIDFSAPAVDVSEEDKAYKITAELPGLEARDIEISVAGDTLVLKGEKRQEKEEKDKNYHMVERAYGSFQRAFMLPQGVDRDEIAAELTKGVLTITLPKTIEAQKPTKKVEIKTA